MDSITRSQGNERNIPKVDMVNGRWVEQSTGNIFFGRTAEAGGLVDNGTYPSSVLSHVPRKGDSIDGQRAGPSSAGRSAIPIASKKIGVQHSVAGKVSEPLLPSTW